MCDALETRLRFQLSAATHDIPLIEISNASAHFIVSGRHMDKGWPQKTKKQNYVASLDQCQVKKVRGTRSLEVQSVNPWCSNLDFAILK